jgi:hypothetical protein
MPPRRRVALVIVAVSAAVAAAVGWLRVLPAVRERQVARDFTALTICLAGSPRVPPDEVRVRARRVHPPRERDEGLVACAELADGLDTRGARAVAPALVAEALGAVGALRQGQGPDNLEALWRAGEHLRWMPAPGAAPRVDDTPAPLLDRDLPALRRALPGFANLHGQYDRLRIDENPVGQVILRANRTLVIGPGPDGRPLAAAAWDAAWRPRAWFVRSSPDRVQLIDPERAERDLGPGQWPAVAGGHVVWKEGRKLRVRRLDAAEASASVLLDLPLGEAELRYASCRSRRADMLAVETKEAVHLLALSNDGVRVWGSVAMPHPEVPAHAGELGLTCAERDVRLAWATSEPTGDALPRMNGDVKLPEDPGRHRVFVATCTERGCARREATATGVDAGWQSIGGWSSAMFMLTPEVIDLGPRVLLVWHGVAGIRYRLAPLEALEGAPSPWLAETSRPEDRDPPEPRTIAWPRWQLHAREGVALVVLQEWGNGSASFVVRVDGSGEVGVIAPPEG